MFITMIGNDSENYFFNDTATTEIYTLSLHDALPISRGRRNGVMTMPDERQVKLLSLVDVLEPLSEEELRELRSEEHTSELQSRQYLVCRLLLEKKTRLLLQSPD